MVRFEKHRWAKEQPIQLLLLAQLIEDIAAAEGALFLLFGEFRAIQQTLSGSGFQATGDVANANIGIAPTTIESADYHIVAGDYPGRLGLDR